MKRIIPAVSRAGVVGAGRFRNALPETRDTLYIIFVWIGVVLAAGVAGVTAAAVISMFFNFIQLAMHRSDYGMCEPGCNPRSLWAGCRVSAGRNLDESKGAPYVMGARIR